MGARVMGTEMLVHGARESRQKSHIIKLEKSIH